jgi:hypothetical protein
MIQKVCKMLDMSMPGLDRFMQLDQLDRSGLGQMASSRPPSAPLRRLWAEAALPEEAAVGTAIRGGNAVAIDSGGP